MPQGIIQEAGLRLLGLLAGIVILAFFIGRVAPGKRRRIRRTLPLFVLYVLSLAVATALGPAGLPEWVGRMLFVAQLLAMLTVINLVGIALFDLLLPLLRINVANIMHELALGAAYIVAGIVTLRAAGLNPSSIVATSAVVTAVLAVSLQATLGNVVGGVALQLDDSIHVGDWIELPDGRQGKVKEVKWRHTVVETRNWDTIIVPNAQLLASQFTILGKRDGQPVQHRMWVYFNVDFRYAPAEVIRVVEGALRSAPIPSVAAEPPPNCICFDFAKERRDSFAYYAVRYYLTDLASDDPASSAVRVRLYAALKRENIPLAMPAATLFVNNDDAEHAQRKEMREHERRLKAVSSVDIFGPITVEGKDQLARRLGFAPFAKGEIITRQGTEAHWLYILTAGKVEVRIAGEHGDQKTVATMEAPSFFGEMGLMTGEKRTATVVAHTEVESYRLDKDAFDAVLRERPTVAQDISIILAERRVGLEAARENLDADAKRRRLASERGQILAGIQRFFGLDDRA